MAPHVGIALKEAVGAGAMEWKLAVENRLAGQVATADTSIRRYAGLLIATVIGFELLMASQVSTVDVLGAQLRDPDLLLLLLPVLVAAFLAQTTRSVGAYMLYSELQTAALMSISPRLADNHLEFFIVPGQQNLASSAQMFEHLIDSRPISRIFNVLQMTLYGTVTLGALGHVITAYARLLSRDGLSKGWTFASLGVAVLLVMVAGVEWFGRFSIASSPRGVPTEDNPVMSS